MDNSFDKVMVIDDTPANLRLLKEMLQKIGFTVSVFRSGKDALCSLEYSMPSIILMDINMPEMDGYETCRKIKQVDAAKDIPIIFISALSEVGDKITAFRNGGVDYITKPFEFEEVQERINTHLKISRLQMDVSQLNKQLEQRVSDQLDEIALANKRLLSAQNAIILSLAKLAECRDSDTGLHLDRVGFFCEAFAKKLAQRPSFPSINRQFISTLKNVAPLHDIGKVGIEDRILLKPDRLTDEEFVIMRTHTSIGAKTFLTVKNEMPDSPYVEMAYEVILHHHERFDGSGYPDALAGDEIPICAQIMAIADVYDALRSNRPYKKPMSRQQSEDIIINSSGTHFSPIITSVFAECTNEFDAIFTRLTDN